MKREDWLICESKFQKREKKAEIMYNEEMGEGAEFMTKEELVKKAYEAQKFSYSPYSGFQVGVALLTGNGKIYTGCNIENVAFSPTNCAERTAFSKRYRRENRNLKPLQLWEIKKRLCRKNGNFVLLVEYADR